MIQGEMLFQNLLTGRQVASGAVKIGWNLQKALRRIRASTC